MYLVVNEKEPKLQAWKFWELQICSINVVSHILTASAFDWKLRMKTITRNSIGYEEGILKYMNYVLEQELRFSGRVVALNKKKIRVKTENTSVIKEKRNS